MLHEPNAWSVAGAFLMLSGMARLLLADAMKINGTITAKERMILSLSWRILIAIGMILSSGYAAAQYFVAAGVTAGTIFWAYTVVTAKKDADLFGSVPRNEAIECLLKMYALNPAYLELSQYPELSFTINTKRLFEMRPRERKEEDRPEIYRKQDMRYLYAEPVFVPE
jgi:hypothetical protein